MQLILPYAKAINNLLSQTTDAVIMATLQYTIIKSAAQYNKYCNLLEELVASGKRNRSVQDQIDLLTLLIEKYDAENNTIEDTDPVAVLKYLMQEHNMKAVTLAEVLNLSEGLVSDMLNYKKGLSKETIRRLAAYFKCNQELFNRPYELKVPAKPLARKVRTATKRRRSVRTT